MLHLWFSRKKAFFVSLLAVLFLLGGLHAAQAAGRVTEGDFTFHGVALGDSAEKLHKAWGEPVFYKDTRVKGVAVRTESYPKDVDVMISRRTGKVVDIRVNLKWQKDLELRNHVKYGATSAWLQRTYGKTERQNIGGVFYYIYARPTGKKKTAGRPYDRMLLELDSEDWHLVRFRLTSLPLTDAEADERADDADPEEIDPLIAAKTIDTSALPKTETPKLTMGGQP